MGKREVSLMNHKPTYMLSLLIDIINDQYDSLF